MANYALGFDYGTKKTGLAIANLSTGLITPFSDCLLMRDGIPDWDQLEQLLAQWQPKQLVVGQPFSEDTQNEPSYVAMEKRIKKFKNRLFGRYGLPCHWQDERLTSVEAEQIHCDSSHEWYKIPIDNISAALILQQWINTL